ncbi:MAG TPA: VCBS repeat-containing protein [Thermoanaerobaculia bacterium]|nr:VCBS repeat-containing protein [Thermoanaerobaculia bacterium]
MSIRVLPAVVLSILIIPLSAAQTQPETTQPETAATEIEGGVPEYIKDETPEERRQRIGPVDPGPNPTADQRFERRGRVYKIERFDRQWAAYDAPEGFVRPFAMVNFGFEIYQQNDRYVWVWMPGSDDDPALVEQKPAEPTPTLTEAQAGYLRNLRNEFSELTPPPAGRRVRFEESSEGLPSQGSWRHSAAFADMNGDGHIDIIAPPERGARSIMPAIFLGDGKGNWTPWAAAVWPYVMDYGTVVAADFNGDGRTDLAFGMHLVGPRVLLNNGDGRFVDASKGMEESWPTRRVVAADVDGDGDVDLVALSEGTSRGSGPRSARLRAYINDGKASSWSVVEISGPDDLLGGDWLATGKFNKDRLPDFVASSNMMHGVDTLYRSAGKAKWERVDPEGGELVPYYSLYTAVAAGRYSSRTLDDAIVSYRRVWPQVDANEMSEPPFRSVIGIDRISFGGKTPQRTPVMRFEGERPISGMASGDFDGDGKTDILFTRFEPREVVLLLGDGKGGFKRAEVEGLPLMDNPNYDLNVADVNGDKLPDVLVMYESTSQTPFGRQNGGMKLFLNRGAGVAGSGAAAK